jgi:hypothetical protein
MTTVASLVINMATDTASFFQGMERVHRGLGNVEKSAARLRGPLLQTGFAIENIIASGAGFQSMAMGVAGLAASFGGVAGVVGGLIAMPLAMWFQHSAEEARHLEESLRRQKEAIDGMIGADISRAISSGDSPVAQVRAQVEQLEAMAKIREGLQLPVVSHALTVEGRREDLGPLMLFGDSIANQIEMQRRRLAEIDTSSVVGLDAATAEATELRDMLIAVARSSQSATVNPRVVHTWNEIERLGQSLLDMEMRRSFMLAGPPAELAGPEPIIAAAVPAIQNLENAMDDVVQKHFEMMDAAEKWGQAVETPAEAASRQMLELNTLLDNGVLSLETYRRAVEQLTQQWSIADEIMRLALDVPITVPARAMRRMSMPGFDAARLDTDLAKYLGSNLQAAAESVRNGRGSASDVAKQSLNAEEKSERHLRDISDVVRSLSFIRVSL